MVGRRLKRIVRQGLGVVDEEWLGAVTLDKVGVGGIVERSVPALIAQPGQLRTSLLGMSFLNRLESWEVRGDKLIMRGYP